MVSAASAAASCGAMKSAAGRRVSCQRTCRVMRLSVARAASVSVSTSTSGMRHRSSGTVCGYQVRCNAVGSDRVYSTYDRMRLSGSRSTVAMSADSKWARNVGSDQCVANTWVPTSIGRSSHAT